MSKFVDAGYSEAAKVDRVGLDLYYLASAFDTVFNRELATLLYSLSTQLRDSADRVRDLVGGKVTEDLTNTEKNTAALMQALLMKKDEEAQ